MVARRLLGIVFTPSWVRVAFADLSKDCDSSVRVYGVPLPVGCINEDSGAVEDSSALEQAMRAVPCINRRYFRQGSVFLVVPQLLCYRTAFIVPAKYSSAPLQRLIEENVADLPGDRSSLIVSAYTHDPRRGEPQRVMVIAARRLAIEAYTRLFGGDAWCIGGITTGEVARFNRLRLHWSELDSKVALVCGADTESWELSVWNRGVLLASDTRYWRERDRAACGGKRVNVENLDEQFEHIARAIIKSIESQRDSLMPVECVCFGGLLRERKDLQERISAMSGVAHHTSTTGSLFAGATREDVGRDSMRSRAIDDNGLFDDAIGAIAPMMGALRGRWRREAGWST